MDAQELVNAAASFRAVAAAQATGKPVFRFDRVGRDSLFYTPGYLCVVKGPQADAFQARLGQDARGCAGELWRCAGSALEAWDRLTSRPFAPECLTLSLNNECNLRCSYCHSQPCLGSDVRLGVRAIRAGAATVARSCHDAARPLYVVLHGGGEPLLRQGHASAALDAVEAVAGERGLPVTRYVATNGLMSEKKARWLAGRVERIGLSCDGPAELQDSQRARADGRPSAAIVERTGRIAKESGAQLLVRTTITRSGFTQQAAIAEYLLDRLAPQELTFEPVYRVGRGAVYPALAPRDAADFVAGYLQAARVANARGVPMHSSVDWATHLHGPFCHVLRGVLNLVPGDLATACFRYSRAEDVAQHGLVVGALQTGGGQLLIDEGCAADVRARALTWEEGCCTCFNQYHCARLCPEQCHVRPVQDSPTVDLFRCNVQRAITLARLTQKAEELLTRTRELQEPQESGVLGAPLPLLSHDV